MQAVMENQLLQYLKTALNDPAASFRGGQRESIEQLLKGNRALVVQRTGWGKSMVYFLAAKMLRAQGAGPTLIISPLLALMRNQIEAARGLKITARTINSGNAEEWDKIRGELLSNKTDVLLISPERLANDGFRKDILANIADNIGLFVVDEAHCISDWGHDFRPDYRLITRVLRLIPSNVPVLATTATANDRVVDDIKTQLGENIILQRGPLVRKSLKLQNIDMPSPAARMAWLAKTIPALPGSGIVYTLTQRDAEQVAGWLKKNNIAAAAYYAGLSAPEDDASARERLEQRLLNNEIKALVATVALGMGFDKPDLGFVIHFQRPASVVHYYQQVGRAGRAVDNAYGILLCGEEDDHIADYFIRSAFPPQQHVSELLQALKEAEDGLSIADMQRVLNLRKGQIEKTVKFLTVESPSPIAYLKPKWRLTAGGINYRLDQEYVNAITAIRRDEQRQMRDYMAHSGCLMAFLQAALDDPSAGDCGQCKNCNPAPLPDESYDDDLANRAVLFLRRGYRPIKPRKRWPAANMFTLSGLGEHTTIPPELRSEEGRALSLWNDAGWGSMVKRGKYRDGKFAGELVTACAKMLREWSPAPAPRWVACIPSLQHPELVPDFAKRLAGEINLPFFPCLEKIRQNKPQKEMANSYQQAKNLDGAFSVAGQYPSDACLLVDDVVDSGWTFTVAAALLRRGGCAAVYPAALALNSPRMD